jgi:hypothetical protein
MYRRTYSATATPSCPSVVVVQVGPAVPDRTDDITRVDEVDAATCAHGADEFVVLVDDGDGAPVLWGACGDEVVVAQALLLRLQNVQMERIHRL